MGIVKFSIWLNIPNKYIEDLYVIVSVIVGYIFRKINWHIFTRISAFVFWYFSALAVVLKLDVNCE